MRNTAAVLMCLMTALLLSAPAGASRDGISTIIEAFMAKQFPEAKSRFWVVNGTQWQTEEEIVVDVNTVVMVKADQAPTENRYLLLIVGDRLAATQNIPVDAKTDCSPERT